jgi:hypothetical protein
MTEWEAMVIVKNFRNYFQVQGGDPAFQCRNCKASITLFQCTYTPNSYGADDTPIPGGLYCSLCERNTARSCAPFIMKDEAKFRARMAREAEEELEDEESDEDPC